QPGLHDGEDRHGFSKAVNGGAPALLEQKEDGRDQRSGVADTNPPHKVDNGKAPTGGYVDAPNSGASEKQIAEGGIEYAEQHYRHSKNHEPEDRSVLLQHNATDPVSDRAHVVAGPEQGRSYTLWRHNVDLFDLGHQFSFFSPDSSSGFGLRTAAI